MRVPHKFLVVARAMAESALGQGPPEVPEKVARMRAVVNGQAMSAWDQLWTEQTTPWDLEQVTPVVASLIRQEGRLPQGRALVPGCGLGYDVVALSSPTRFVVGLDISETAMARARARVGTTSPFVEFVVHDFFTYAPAAPFDLIFDYTFFAAMEPSMRSAWAKKMAELLTPTGLLVTLMFPIAEYAGGPPYALSVKAYEDVLHPVGLKAVLFEDMKELSVEARRGRELLAFWEWDASKL